MAGQKRQSGTCWPALFVVFGLVDFTILLALLLRGRDIELFHPKGLIAQQEFRLIVLTGIILLAVAVPSVLLFYLVAWRYRETNHKVSHDPGGGRSKYLLSIIWGIPTLVMVVMACIMWTSTHKLDPHTSIASNAKPLTIQVIALRWKWLFVYPQEQVASVNFVQLPTDRPVRFELTADEAPMSSFWIPHLSGQLYAMTGHINELNLIVKTPGSYPGSSAEINGAGYAGMRFVANVDTTSAFDAWVGTVKSSAKGLDAQTYASLVKPSEDNSPQSYAYPSGSLYSDIVMKYSGSHIMAGME